MAIHFDLTSPGEIPHRSPQFIPDKASISKAVKTGDVKRAGGKLEFSSGVKPYVNEAFLKILFDEVFTPNEVALITDFDFADAPNLEPSGYELVLEKCVNLSFSLLFVDRDTKNEETLRLHRALFKDEFEMLFEAATLESSSPFTGKLEGFSRRDFDACYEVLDYYFDLKEEQPGELLQRLQSAQVCDAPSVFEECDKALGAHFAPLVDTCEGSIEKLKELLEPLLEREVSPDIALRSLLPQTFAKIDEKMPDFLQRVCLKQLQDEKQQTPDRYKESQGNAQLCQIGDRAAEVVMSNANSLVELGLFSGLKWGFEEFAEKYSSLIQVFWVETSPALLGETAKRNIMTSLLRANTIHSEAFAQLLESVWKCETAAEKGSKCAFTIATCHRFSKTSKAALRAIEALESSFCDKLGSYGTVMKRTMGLLKAEFHYMHPEDPDAPFVKSEAILKKMIEEGNAEPDTYVALSFIKQKQGGTLAEARETLQSCPASLLARGGSLFLYTFYSSYLKKCSGEMLTDGELRALFRDYILPPVVEILLKSFLTGTESALTIKDIPTPTDLAKIIVWLSPFMHLIISDLLTKFPTEVQDFYKKNLLPLQA